MLPEYSDTDWIIVNREGAYHGLELPTATYCYQSNPILLPPPYHPATHLRSPSCTSLQRCYSPFLLPLLVKS